jgi:hypothetical protein
MRPEVKEALDVVCAAVSTRVVQADEVLFLIKKKKSCESLPEVVATTEEQYPRRPHRFLTKVGSMPFAPAYCYWRSIASVTVAEQ